MERRLPTIDAALFREIAEGDPEAAFEAWETWIGGHPGAKPEARYRKLLEIAVERGEAAVRHYFKRPYRLSRDLVDRLDAISRRLGQAPPTRRVAAAPPRPPARVERHPHVVVLSQLDPLPNAGFHVAMFAALEAAAGRLGLSLSFHAVAAENHMAQVLRIQAQLRPAAVVYLRVTPSVAELERFRRHATPVALVHAARLAYPEPVIVHVVPDHGRIVSDLTGWLTEHAAHHRTKRASDAPVVMVAMPDEADVNAFPELRGVRQGVRAERREKVWAAIAPFGGTEFPPLRDYSFRHAIDVWKAHAGAGAFVCLSDTLAVGLELMMRAARQDPRHRLVGFDASPLAQDAGIASFDQGIDRTATLALDAVASWLDGPDRPAFPAMREEPALVRLKPGFYEPQRGEADETA